MKPDLAGCSLLSLPHFRETIAMNRSVRACSLFTAVALTACLGTSAVAQSLPSQPVPVAPPLASPGPAVPPPPVLTPPPPPLPAPIDSPPLPSHDSWLDASSTPCGWFAALELGIVEPHLKNNLVGNVSFGDLGSDTVQLPTARLEWVGAPRFEVGYHFADDCGDILFAYRTFSSRGHAVIPDYDFLGDGFLTSRLDLDVFDLDYVTSKIALGHCLDLKLHAGVRLADIFFDSQAAGQFLEQRISNRFIGAGPHAGLDLYYHSPVPGLGLFARIDGALPIGNVHQGFEETFTFNDGSQTGSAATQNSTRLVETINAQLGVSWVPLGTRLRFSAGYEYEYWWGIGHAGASRAELFDQGAFFRAEFNY
jgi:hypothetical protein